MWLALAAILIAAFIIGVGVALLGGMDTGRSHAFFDKFEARKPTEDENE